MQAILRASTLATFALLTSVAASATTTDLGIAINGGCVAGTCNTLSLSTEPVETLSYSRQIELANGDVFGVAVQLERALTPPSGQRFIKVEYLGHAASGALALDASQSDTLTIDLLRAWSTSTGEFTATMAGALSQGLAAGSSLGIKIGDPSTHQAVADFGTFDAIGPFSKTLSYKLSVNTDTAVSDGRYSFSIGQGTQVGSFFVLGSPVPEPGTWALMALGLIATGGASTWRRRIQGSDQNFQP